MGELVQMNLKWRERPSLLFLLLTGWERSERAYGTYYIVYYMYLNNLYRGTPVLEIFLSSTSSPRSSSA